MTKQQKIRKQNREAFARYYAVPKNKKKHALRLKARYEIRMGRMDVPKKCEQCGKRSPLQAHHYAGYSKTSWCKVKFLCSTCHGLAHRLEYKF